MPSDSVTHTPSVLQNLLRSVVGPLATAVLAAALISASGCSWFGQKNANSTKKEKPKPSKLVKIDREVKIKRLWRAKVGSGLGRKFIRTRPAILADQVFAADAYGTVVSHDRFNGKRLWKVQIGKPVGKGLKFWDRRDPGFVTGGVGAGGGQVYVGTTTGDVVALSASDGTEQWRIDIGTESVVPPVYDDGRVYIQTIDGRLLARDSGNGDGIWAFDSQVPVLTLRGTATPTVNDGIVYSGFADGMLMALNGATGERLWGHRVMLPQGRSELDRMVDVDSSPLVVGPLIYAVSFQGRLKAVRLSDGRPLWERESSSFLDLATGYGQLYVIDEEDKIVAIDQDSAEEAWSNTALARRSLSSPVAYNNYLLVGDDEGYLHVVAQSDGRFLGRTRLDGAGLRSPFTVADGTVYAFGTGGSLTAFEIEALN